MRIANVEAIPFRIARDMGGGATGSAGSPTLLAPGRGDYRWSEAYPALYSVNIETALIKVTLDTGMVGWGEAQAPLAPEVACAIVDRLLAPVLIGVAFDGSVAEIEHLWMQMYSTMRVRGQTGGFMLDAISGVDIALWDLAGKIVGVPVSALIWDPKAKVPAYISGLSGPDKAEAARPFANQGFGKFKLFLDGSWPAMLADVESVRRLGLDVAVDALWHLDPNDAPSLDPYSAMWLEAPLPPEDPIAHGALARSITTPIAVGESYRTSFEFAPFFREHAMRIVQPDLGRCGITEALRIARIAAAHGLPIVPHVSIAMGPQVAAAIHFAAAVENCSLLEYNPKVLEVANRFLVEPLIMKDACYHLSERPGLGIEMRL
jgi:D-galactarolactone cycloisomerase